jgi:hypothetical protein
LNDYNLQGYLEQFRTDDCSSRGGYNIDNGLFIGRAGLGPITTIFERLIMCFETGTVLVTKSNQRRLSRRVAVFFPDMNYSFYVIEDKFNMTFSQYYYNINLPIEKSGKINARKLPPINTCVEYYKKFVNDNSLSILHITVESLLRVFLNNANNIALIINLSEVTLLLFKNNKNSGYEDVQLDYQINFKFTPKNCYIINKS